MTDILQTSLPEDVRAPRPLPGVQPSRDGKWLRADDAYDAQMRHRRALLATRGDAVHWQDPLASEAAAEVLSEALALLPGMGMTVELGRVICPDGHIVLLDEHAPLAVLGRIVQEDICILQKRGDEHVLTAAVLCFPAYWMLSEKAGRPLTHIHGTVPEYDADIARRVQRLFDGVQVGRPLWRSNRIWRDDPELFQPLSVTAKRRAAPEPQTARFVRVERQCILRLPVSGAVVFTIHTYMVENVSAAADR